MNTRWKCPKCSKRMKQIPIKKLDSTFVIELYCDSCDESITFYPEIRELKFKRTDAFGT